MAEDRYSGEIYFIVPRDSLEYSISDWMLSDELLKIYASEKVDKVYLKKRREL